MSHDGQRLATGQANHGGVKAPVIVWDLDAAKHNCDSALPASGGLVIHRLHQHLGKVQDIGFSCDDKYLATLGGQDDNALVVWDTESGEAICGSPAAQDSAFRSGDRKSAGFRPRIVWREIVPAEEFRTSSVFPSAAVPPLLPILPHQDSNGCK